METIQRLWNSVVLALFDCWLFLAVCILKISVFTRLELPHVPGGHGHYDVVVSGGLLLLLIGGVLLASRATRMIIFLTLSALISILLVTDHVYLRFFNRLPSVALLPATSQSVFAWESIYATLERTHVFLFLDVPLWLFLIFYGRARDSSFFDSWSSGRHRARIGVVSGLVGLLLISPLLYFGTVQDSFKRGIYGQAQKTYTVGLMGYHLMDIKGFFQHRDWVTEDDKKRVRSFFETKLSTENKAPSPISGAGKGYNLVFLQVESLQSFVVGRSVNGQEITPALNDLADSAMLEANIYDVSSVGATADGTFAMMNSLVPSPRRMVSFYFKDNHFQALPEILADRGYTTLSISAGKSLIWNDNQLYERYGFQRRKFSGHRFPDQQFNWWGPADKPFLKGVSKELGTTETPFFVFAKTVSSHHPFKIPKQHQQLELPSLQGTELGNYYQAIRYFDGALEQFIEQLRTRGVLKDTIVVITADHAIFSPEQVEDMVGDDTNRIPGLTDTKIPFIVFHPKYRGKSFQVNVGSQIDVPVTLLELLGINTGNKYMLGSNLVNPSSTLVAFPSGGGSDNRYVSIPGRTGDGRSCYSLPEQQFVTPNKCSTIRKQADTYRTISKTVLLGDLVPR